MKGIKPLTSRQTVTVIFQYEIWRATAEVADVGPTRMYMSLKLKVRIFGMRKKLKCFLSSLCLGFCEYVN